VDVLKITITETATDRRWNRAGALGWAVGQRAENNLEEDAIGARNKRACIIDLNDVTFIDKSGERLLRAMSKKRRTALSQGSVRQARA